MMKSLAKSAYLALRGLALRPFYGPPAEIDRAAVKKILVLRFDRVGDMVLATPLLAALREAFPDARLEVLASEANAGVLAGLASVDETHVLPRRGRLAFLAGLRARGYDLLVDPNWDYTLEWGKIARELGARWSVGLDTAGRGLYYNVRVPGPLPPAPAPELMLAIARAGLKLPLPSRLPRVAVSAAEREAGRRLLGEAGLPDGEKAVLLHPGGHYESQRWPVESFAKAAEALRGALIGGPQDDALLARVSCPKIRTKDVRELAGALSHARLLICNNSGPLHLACALGIPTLSTLGPSDAAVWSPPHPHQILKGMPVSTIAVDDVVARARLMLGGPR